MSTGLSFIKLRLIYFPLCSRIMTIHFSLTSTEDLPSPRLLESVLTHQNHRLPEDNMVSLVLSLNKPSCIGFTISLSLTVLHHLQVKILQFQWGVMPFPSDIWNTSHIFKLNSNTADWKQSKPHWGACYPDTSSTELNKLTHLKTSNKRFQ